MNDRGNLSTLARGLADRRITLRLAATSLAGVLFPSLALDAGARCGRIRSRCRRNGDCCAGARCKRKRCKCRPGHASCEASGACVDLANDDRHCGACHNACQDGWSCSDHACCKAGEVGCDGDCCSRLEECLPKGASEGDVCCTAENVFVLCDEGYIQESGGHFLCFAPPDIMARSRRICCPAESLCGDYCCEPTSPGQTSTCLPAQRLCLAIPRYDAQYVRPGRRPN